MNSGIGTCVFPVDHLAIAAVDDFGVKKEPAARQEKGRGARQRSVSTERQIKWSTTLPAKVLIFLVNG